MYMICTYINICMKLQEEDGDHDRSYSGTRDVNA